MHAWVHVYFWVLGWLSVHDGLMVPAWPPESGPASLSVCKFSGANLSVALVHAAFSGANLSVAHIHAAVICYVSIG